MTTLELLREKMTAFLQSCQVNAVSAWPENRRLHRSQPVVVVQVSRVEGADAGFQRYLGETEDPVTGKWAERYGQTVTVTFSLDLYSPESAGEALCRRLLDQVADAFQQGGPDGLAIKQWTMEDTAFEHSSGMFRGRVSAVCEATFVTLSDEYGAFLGFEVKGEIRR